MLAGPNLKHSIQMTLPVPAHLRNQRETDNLEESTSGCLILSSLIAQGWDAAGQSLQAMPATGIFIC